ncbi:porin family protein [Tenacibaculum sp. L6]|uniref:porin family protein n=1 Tax=Tenacibaculum sp. L6 TaxID=2992764 RepID=UPI00237A6360|nr:porin family protein [Tenacibaculum sp. L6]MDE0535633.1 porin family protein [Tenacibaculum sp. L6]
MKKLLLVIAMVAAGFTANAQEGSKGGFEKQDWYVTGTAGYSDSSEGDSDASVFTFSPSVGYFVSENIALEAGLIIGSGSQTSVGNEVDYNSFGVNLGGNYFFTPKNDFSFIVGAGLSYVSSGREVNGVDQPDSDTFAIVVAPGVNYFISENFALRASIGALSYSNTSIDVNGAPSTDNFRLNLNLSDINFGLTYKF